MLKHTQMTFMIEAFSSVVFKSCKLQQISSAESKLCMIFVSYYLNPGMKLSPHAPDRYILISGFYFLSDL